MANEKEKLIVVEKSSNGIATITLNRPKALNALTREMLVTLALTFTRLDEDPDVKVIILTGAGRAFSAGVVSTLFLTLQSTMCSNGNFKAVQHYSQIFYITETQSNCRTLTFSEKPRW